MFLFCSIYATYPAILFILDLNSQVIFYYEWQIISSLCSFLQSSVTSSNTQVPVSSSALYTSGAPYTTFNFMSPCFWTPLVTYFKDNLKRNCENMPAVFRPSRIRRVWAKYLPDLTLLLMSLKHALVDEFYGWVTRSSEVVNPRYWETGSRRFETKQESWNVANQLPSDLVSYLKSKDTSSTLLRSLETGIVSKGMLYKPSPLTE